MLDGIIAEKTATDPTWHDTQQRPSYTWGSPEGVAAVIAALPDRYPMELIAHDMEALLRALLFADAHDACGCPAGECDPDTCWRQRAASIAGSIAETVGVEWV